MFWQQTERVKRKLFSTYPCLLSVEKDSVTPRMPSLKLRMASRKKEIIKITLQEMADQDRTHYGLKGSATKVRKIFPPSKVERKEVRKMEGQEAAVCIREILNEYQKGRN